MRWAVGAIQQQRKLRQTAYESWANSTNLNTGNNNITVPKPAGLASGDVVVMVGVSRNSYLGLPTGGTAFTQRFVCYTNGTVVTAGTGGNDLTYLWWKVAGSSEPANYTTAVTDAGLDSQTLMTMRFSGATTVGSYTHNGGGSGVCNSVTGAVDAVLLTLHTCVFATSANTLVAPSGMTKRGQIHEPTNDSFGGFATELLTSGGATGTRTWQSPFYTSYAFNINVVVS